MVNTDRENGTCRWGGGEIKEALSPAPVFPPDVYCPSMAAFHLFLHDEIIDFPQNIYPGPSECYPLCWP